MKSHINFLFRYFFFWLCIFFICRLFFVTYHFDLFTGLTRWNKFFLFIHGIRMDASMAAYFCIFPFMFSIFIHKRLYSKSIKVYSYFLSFIIGCILIPDLELYNSWKYRMEYSVLDYFKNTNELTASISHVPLVLIAFLFFLFLLLFHFLYRRLLTDLNSDFINDKRNISTVLIMLIILVLPMRGGIGIAPLNPGAAYFSNQSFSNHSAINVVWNFFYTAVNRKIKNHPFLYLDDEKADAIYNEMMKVDTLSFKNPNISFKLKKPNILFIIWEGFTQKVIDQKFNGIDITPGFNLWKKRGVYFSNSYASGDRTEKGIAAILSGYPAQALTSIVKETSKAASLPILSKSFNSFGYHSSFYYGGDLEFANMKAYLVNGQFDYLVSKDDFPREQITTKWGVHDHHLIEKYLSNKTKSFPFFDVLLTLSSHEPFDVPMEKVFNGKDKREMFFNSLHYSDKCFSSLMNKVSKETWWDSTVIIVLGDHGHPLPISNIRLDDFKTPILFTGGAIDTSFTTNNVFSQTDIAATLLDLLGMDTKPYLFSKPYNKSRNSAYFAFNNGFGLVEKDKYVIFDNNSKKIIENKSMDEKLLLNGKAFQQKTFQHYLDCDKKK